MLIALILILTGVYVPAISGASVFDDAAIIGTEMYTNSLNYGTEILQSDKYIFLVLGAS